MRQAPPISRFLKYPATSATAAIAIAITAAWWYGWDISWLKDDERIRQGQIWRLVTCVFPHLSIYHIAFNVYWVWVFGTLVEEIFGSLKTVLLFILLAIGSSAPEFAILSGGFGLSGVGYGLFGFLWVLSRRDERFHNAVDQNTILLFTVWFLICIGLTISKIMPVANIAHGAGAVAGALTAFYISSRSVTNRLAAGAGVTVLVVGGVVASTFGRAYVNLSQDNRYESRLAYEALKRNENDQAMHWLRDAVRIEPNDASTWFNLGIAYDRLGMESDSADSFRRASELDPNDKDFREAAGKSR